MNSSNSMELPPSTIKAILTAFRQCVSPCQKINATQHHMVKLPFPVLSKCQTCGVFGTHIKLEFSATHNSLIWHQFLFDYLSNFTEFVWDETAQRGLMLETGNIVHKLKAIVDQQPALAHYDDQQVAVMMTNPLQLSLGGLCLSPFL